MAKQRFKCEMCFKRIEIQAFCPHCGQPTPAATTHDRIVWEMGQWEKTRPTQPEPVQPKKPEPARVMSLRATTPPPRSVSPASSVAPVTISVERVAPPTPAPAIHQPNVPVQPAARMQPAASIAQAPRPTQETQLPRKVRRTPADAIARRQARAEAPSVVTPSSAVAEGSLLVEAPPVVAAVEDAPTVAPHTDNNDGVLLVRRRRRAAAVSPMSSEQVAPDAIEEASVDVPDAPVEARAEVAAAPPVEAIVEDVVAKEVVVTVPTPAPTKEPKMRRRDRLGAKDVAKMNLVAGERTLFAMRGRSIGHATIALTNYRLIVRSRRTGSVRWIPLEEISSVNTVWRGIPTLLVGASVEFLRFRNRSNTSMSELVTMIRTHVRVARSGTPSHRNAELTQAWCDLTTTVWESNVGRVRLFIRRHPVFTLGWLTAVMPIAYVAAQR